MSSDRSDASTFTPALLGLVWTAMFGFSAFFFSYSTVVSLAALGGLSTVTGGSILTTMMVGVIVAQPFAPWVGRFLGLRGALLFALGLQVFGQILGLVVAPALLGLILAGLSGGVGFGLFVVLANAAVPATTSPGRIGKALGIFGGITSLASAVGAPLGLWLVGTVPVWTFRTIVCVCLLIAVPTILKFLPGKDSATVSRSKREGRNAEAEMGKESAATISTDESPADRSTPDESPAGTASSDASMRGGEDGQQVARRKARGVGEALGLIIMLSPFLIGMVVFGLIVGFGPGSDVAGAAIFIAVMQVSAVVGRFVSGAIADQVSPFGLNILGLVLAAIGLVVTVIVSGGLLVVAMIIIGLGLGTLQSASLVMAFSTVSTPTRASVAWNMNFDIGLAIAGVLGGLGFTYLGDSATFLFCALLLLITGALSWIARTISASR